MITFLLNAADQFTARMVLAIAIATIVSGSIGAIYYTATKNAWHRASLQPHQSTGRHRPFSTYLVALVGYALVAVALFGVTRHATLGHISMRSCLIAAGLAWLGFIASTMTINHRLEGRPVALTAINSGHWLLVLGAQGLVIGLFAST